MINTTVKSTYQSPIHVECNSKLSPFSHSQLGRRAQQPTFWKMYEEEKLPF